MSDSSIASLRTWLASPMDRAAAEAVERLRRAPDVQEVAVMPDVHLAADTCVGVVAGTSALIYPQAVGGDIGCGMLALELDLQSKALESKTLESKALLHSRAAAQVLAGLYRAVPARRRNRRDLIGLPADLSGEALSHPYLESIRRAEGALEFATLGSGNHFLELQADEDGRLWLMVHSGSRAIGQAVRDHYLACAQPVGGGLRAIEAASGAGAGYLHDAAFARRFAAASRAAIAEEAGRVLEAALGARLLWQTAITTDHNHVALERHRGRELWVHRKGAMPAGPGERGVLPGSMGTLSFHVEGRGNEESMCSSAHGAGRAFSRANARRKITEREFRRQMEGIWFDSRIAGKLRDEAPAAYKDVRAVLRAQKDLVKVTRTLRPVLNYKGT